MSHLMKTWTGQSQRSQASQDHSNDPFSGHVGHLTEAQADSLSHFKKICSEKNLYEYPSDKTPASHDDATLLRFLRARKFDLTGALGQFSDTEKWRAVNKIDALYEHMDVDSYERARVMYPQWTGHRDRRGLPLYVYVIKDLNQKNMSSYLHETEKSPTTHLHTDTKMPKKMLRLFALYENMLRFVLPLTSSLDRPNPEVPITQGTNIVDISGVGLKQFWNLKGHMQEASVLATAHYPETLDRIFIIGAPSFFPTVWGWIKRWFDPVTVSKIFILSSHEVKPTLIKYFDPESLPKHYGGNLDWEFGHTPKLDHAALKMLGRVGNDWIRGHVLWDGTKEIAVGSVKGKSRREVVAVAPEDALLPKPTAAPVEVTANGYPAPPNGVALQPGEKPPPTPVQEPVAEEAEATNENVEEPPSITAAEPASAYETQHDDENALNATAASQALPQVESSAPTTSTTAPTSAPEVNGSAHKSPPTEIPIPDASWEKGQNGELPTPMEPAFMTPLESPGDLKAVLANGMLK